MPINNNSITVPVVGNAVYYFQISHEEFKMFSSDSEEEMEASNVSDIWFIFNFTF